MRDPEPLVAADRRRPRRGPVWVGRQGFALDVTRPGDFLVRVNFTPYWSIARGAGCLLRRGEWTVARAAHPGIFRVAADFSLGRRLERGDRRQEDLLSDAGLSTEAAARLPLMKNSSCRCSLPWPWLVALLVTGPGAAAAPTTCPSFRVLHDDRIGPAVLPAGNYAITIDPTSGLACGAAAKLFARFLEDYDGVLPRPWRVTGEGSGKASVKARRRCRLLGLAQRAASGEGSWAPSHGTSRPSAGTSGRVRMFFPEAVLVP